MNLTELSKTIHQNAVNKGFWDKELSNEHCLMLVICELAEAIEADRKGKRANIEYFKSIDFDKSKDPQQMFKDKFEHCIKDTVEDELADAVIRLLDLSGVMGIEIKAVNKLSDEDVEYYRRTFPLPVFCYYCSRTLTKFDSETQYRIINGIGAIIAYCQANDINLMWHIEQKMKYNESREQLHGKKY
ncbi:MAG: hypothetical protein RR382_08170 [Tannerellaceae bacterium]